MKLLFFLILLAIIFLACGPAETKKTDTYNFELTVTSMLNDPVEFDIAITGVLLTKNDEKKLFNLQKHNIRTPYKLNLEEGKYKVVLNSKGGNNSILSKVQGFKNGKKAGMASASDEKVILEFAPEKFAARAE